MAAGACKVKIDLCYAAAASQGQTACVHAATAVDEENFEVEERKIAAEMTLREAKRQHRSSKSALRAAEELVKTFEDEPAETPAE